MKDVMAMVNLMEPEGILKEISHHRLVAAVPFGGRYRMIDFVLSNMVNSGIRNVGIIVQNKYRSLIDHLGRGKEWDLDRKRDGLFFLPPTQMRYPLGTRFDLRHFQHHLDYINNSRQNYIIITGSNMICNLDYRDVINFHREQRADITLLYKEMDVINEESSPYAVIETDQDYRVLDMEISPDKISSNKISMEMCIMEKSLLIDLINCCASKGECDLVRHGLIKNLNRYRIVGYPFKGYLARISSTRDYYTHSMNLLEPEIWQELFFKHGYIYTKVKDGAPTKYLESSCVQNSIVANDCIIGGTVENSIIFRGVRISKGAHIKNSIVMQKCEIEEGAVIENIITDKKVIISKGKKLIGDSKYPFVIAKETVI
ncbi:glucose-1-phosphate adenylyltransferase subunit GlgD [Desulforamulus aquiferis]|nr:glucose-1-phosphate adenylyltransferase subunit GlgD [Desulforamulus aquiferis]